MFDAVVDQKTEKVPKPAFFTRDNASDPLNFLENYRDLECLNGRYDQRSRPLNAFIEIFDQKFEKFSKERATKSCEKHVNKQVACLPFKCLSFHHTQWKSAASVTLIRCKFIILELFFDLERVIQSTALSGQCRFSSVNKELRRTVNCR